MDLYIAPSNSYPGFSVCFGVDWWKVPGLGWRICCWFKPPFSHCSWHKRCAAQKTGCFPWEILWNCLWDRDCFEKKQQCACRCECCEHSCSQSWSIFWRRWNSLACFNAFEFYTISVLHSHLFFYTYSALAALTIYALIIAKARLMMAKAFAWMLLFPV